jgi:DNA mismatch repair ATPase MutL
LIDDDDKKLFNYFAQPSASKDPITFPFEKSANAPDYFGSMMNGAISKLVDSAMTGITNNGNANANGLDNMLLSSDASQQTRHHRHHHHKRHREAEQQQQPQQDQPQQDQPQQQDQQEQQPQQQEQEQQQQPQQKQEQQSVNQGDSQSLTSEEKSALRELVSVVIGKKDNSALSREVKKILAEELAVPNTNTNTNNAAPPMMASDIDADTATNAIPPSSRPSAPAMTSHIEKTPGASEFIPESVYSQKDVPFAELPQIPKHVAKRILIPRMEEPGPVIGGGSRPSHIQLPRMDDFMSSNTRPAPPNQLQLQLQSSITSATETATAGATTTSVKASSIASANDEALSAPEVVIF